MTGTDDFRIDGTISSTISIAVDAANSDDEFDNVADQAVSASTTDDDTPGFTVVESDNSAGVAEAGTTDTVTVVLDAEPDSTVEFSITTDDDGEATATEILTFDGSNWNTPQTVIITGVDDNIIDGTILSTLTIAINDEKPMTISTLSTIIKFQSQHKMMTSLALQSLRQMDQLLLTSQETRILSQSFSTLNPHQTSKYWYHNQLTHKAEK